MPCFYISAGTVHAVLGYFERRRFKERYVIDCEAVRLVPLAFSRKALVLNIAYQKRGKETSFKQEARRDTPQDKKTALLAVCQLDGRYCCGGYRVAMFPCPVPLLSVQYARDCFTLSREHAPTPPPTSTQPHGTRPALLIKPLTVQPHARALIRLRRRGDAACGVEFASVQRRVLRLVVIAQPPRGSERGVATPPYCLLLLSCVRRGCER